MKRKAGAPSIYADSLKISVAREYLQGEQSYGQLAEKYALNNAGVVRAMVKWYERHYSLEKLSAVKKDDVESVDKRVDTAESELKNGVDKEKDKQLKEALLKVEALELLIANAQKELGIDLVKKLGSKQQGK